MGRESLFPPSQVNPRQPRKNETPAPINFCPRPLGEEPGVRADRTSSVRLHPSSSVPPVPYGTPIAERSVPPAIPANAQALPILGVVDG